MGELFSHAHKDSIRYHTGREAILTLALARQWKLWERTLSRIFLGAFCADDGRVAWRDGEKKKNECDIDRGVAIEYAHVHT